MCDPEHIIILENMEFPEPVIAVAIEPKSKADQDKMGIALQKLSEEDPTFRAHTDKETGETIIEGMGELHLDVIVDRMKREFKVEANIGTPQVAYRETLKGSAECEGKYVRQSVDVDNTVTYGSVLSQMNVAQVLNSSTKSSVGSCLANIFQRFKRV